MNNFREIFLPAVRALVAVALLVSVRALAVPPQRIVIHYDVSYNGLVMAEGRESIQHDDHSYVAESELRGKGVFSVIQRGTVKRTSRGDITPGGLRPLEFRDQRGDRTPEFARFDWAARSVSHERDSERKSSPIGEGTHDRVSFVWNFSFVPPKGQIAAQVVDGRGATQFRYAIAGRETLKTAKGDMEALHLVKIRDPGDARETELWLAVQRSYIPVRLLVVEKDGTRVDQLVTRIEP